MKLQFIEAGEIVSTHGVRGEMKVLSWMDAPEDLCGHTRCKIGNQNYEIVSCRVQKTCSLLKLSGVDTMEAAQALRGRTVLLYREDLPDDAVFASELIGVEVYSEDQMLGSVEDVLDYPGNRVYVVRGAHEYLIPAVKHFVRTIDLEQNRMEVMLIEGMRSDEN